MQDPIAELEAIRKACVEYFGEYASKMIVSKPKADIKLRVKDGFFPKSANGSHVTMCVIQRGSIDFDGNKTLAKFIIVIGSDNKTTEIQRPENIKEILSKEFNLYDVKHECDGISAPVEKGFEEQAQIVANVTIGPALREFERELHRFGEYTSMNGKERHDFRSRLIRNVLTSPNNIPFMSPDAPIPLTQEWVAIDRLSTILSNLTR